MTSTKLTCCGEHWALCTHLKSHKHGYSLCTGPHCGGDAIDQPSHFRGAVSKISHTRKCSCTFIETW